MSAPDFPWGPSFERFEWFLERAQEGWADPAKLLEFWAPSKQDDPALRAWWVGDQEPLISAVERFVTGASVPPAPERVLATVLFADRGDSAVREQVAAFGGREIEGATVGLLASFDGPTRAIRCALAIRAAAHDVRAGVHTGECEVANGGLAGLAVDVCARIGALADPGEILVSRTVTDLVAGSELRFAQRDRALDGLHLLAVA